MTAWLLCLLWVGAPQAAEKVVYAAGYIPNVQFAPFYVAKTRGYYEEEGIELELDYTIGPDTLKLAALNKVQIASADPDAFLNAAARGLPVAHVATLYQSYPIALIAREPILTTSGLKGRRIGVSGMYGSSYLGLKAMLAELNLTLGEVQAVAIGFTQTAALQNERVDAVVGYINHEPVLLEQQGMATHAFTLSKGSNLPGVGLMTSRSLLDRRPDLIDRFLRATFRGMHDVITDPRGCFDLVVESHLPELSAPNRRQAGYQTLLATLPFWRDAYVVENGYGQCAIEAWERLAALLDEEGGGDIAENWRDWVDRTFVWRSEE